MNISTETAYARKIWQTSLVPFLACRVATTSISGIFACEITMSKTIRFKLNSTDQQSRENISIPKKLRDQIKSMKHLYQEKIT